MTRFDQLWSTPAASAAPSVALHPVRQSHYCLMYGTLSDTAEVPVPGMSIGCPVYGAARVTSTILHAQVMALQRYALLLCVWASAVCSASSPGLEGTRALAGTGVLPAGQSLGQVGHLGLCSKRVIASSFSIVRTVCNDEARLIIDESHLSNWNWT